MRKPNDAVRPRSGQRSTLQFHIIDWLTAVLIAAGAIALLLFVVFTPIRVRSSGVSDFYNGDLVFADRLSKYIFGFSRGDAVAVKNSSGSDGSRHIARVVAAAGENVVIAEGRVYINGQLLDESAYADAFDSGLRMEFEIPDGSLLLLPDERGGLGERDVLSCVTAFDDIVGEVRLIAFPLKRISFFS
jgi:signal peptidase I